MYLLVTCTYMYMYAHTCLHNILCIVVDTHTRYVQTIHAPHCALCMYTRILTLYVHTFKHTGTYMNKLRTTTP